MVLFSLQSVMLHEAVGINIQFTSIHDTYCMHNAQCLEIVSRPMEMPFSLPPFPNQFEFEASHNIQSFQDHYQCLGMEVGVEWCLQIN